MPNKNCPFCKKVVSSNDATCPHCTRVLFEKIYEEQTHKSPSHERKQTNESAKTQKTSVKDKLKKIFSKFAFWKTPPVYHKSGNVYSLRNTKADKFKKIGIVVVIVVFLFGFYLRNNNLTISFQNIGFFKEDKSRYYLQTFESVGDKLSENVKSVAKLTGTSKDDQGRLVNNYLYENQNLDIQLFNQKWGIINSEYSNLKQDISNGKLPNQDKINEILNYYKTVYFFSTNELWFRAFDNGDQIQITKITNKIRAAINDEYFNSYMKSRGELAKANTLLSKIDEVSKSAKTETEIDQLKNRIDSCKIYDNCGDYNYLIDKYNNLIHEYNAGINSRNDAVKDLFSRFIGLVDVYLIFPGQTTLEQTTTQE